MTREPTPLMQQYREIKSQHPGAILFFRMGDFYEMFYDDAELAARVLGLTLTSRNNGGAAEVPLAGVPVKAGHEYLRRLVQQGYRVAVCEQVEDPRLAKGVVRREVIETVTPGAAFSDDLLESDRHNYMCALLELGGVIGIAAADVSIGTFRLIVCDQGDVDDVIARLSPREIIVPRALLHNGTGERLRTANALVTEREPWEFDPVLARDELVRRFRVAGLDGLGISSQHDAALGAAGALLRYLSDLQPSGMPHLMRPSVESTGHTMPLDEMTRRNLELTESLRGGAELPNGRSDRERSGTLLGVLDRTLTPMGARKLREWILAPLLDRAEIDARLDAVGALKEHADVQLALAEALDGVRDVERLAAKAAAGRATPRDLGGLRDSLARLPNVEAVLRDVEPAGMLSTIVTRWDACSEIVDLLSRHLVDRPPLAIGSGNDEGATIRGGVDRELDELRALRDGGRDAIAQIQAAERSRTGIASLKVGYNKVFGYFIEVTNANKHLIPADYQRRQTLTGAERYVTPALKEYEERVLTATERIEERERELFEKLRRATGDEIMRLQAVAVQVATLDVLLAFAVVASREGYVRPEMTDEFALNIVAGRHPVVERMMSRETFIPNDVSLTADARMIILTGPNMAGKSTILRQVGLIVLLAQIGSFVPATRATIGIVDRLFTRVGASDNLVRGQSTFMVEMAETSAILHTATSRSLVLLDEIGRGTSTYDGVSIAWAVSEHVHDKIGCKTIFATHYHELTQLADELGALRNYNVAVREVGDEVLFLHRLQPGPADRSYGIEVGRLAGLPDAVIRRARAVLRSFEGDDLVRRLSSSPSEGPAQLSLFGPSTHPVIDRLKDVRTEEMTPLAALQLLDELAGQARS